jgi:hypothetical protein
MNPSRNVQIPDSRAHSRDADSFFLENIGDLTPFYLIVDVYNVHRQYYPQRALLLQY